MKVVWTLIAFFLFGILAQAQSPAPVTAAAQGIGGATGTISVSVQGVNAGTGLKSTPFSADTIQETNRVLADDNRIHQETHGRMFRDSEGRTRSENEFITVTGQKMHNVGIYDPVAGTAIHLDPDKKTATIQHFTSPPNTPPVTPQTALKPATPIFLKAPSSTQEDLGTMDIEGFTVTGTRLTRTTPAGEIGNEQPIVVVSESWFSPDLRVVLLSKTDDPQYGKTTIKMVNIHAAEPDLSLFQVPPDYKVNDLSSQNK